MLLSLPGPPLRQRVLRKVQNLARQVDNINLHFHDTKLFSRVVLLNIFSVPSAGLQPAQNVDQLQMETAAEEVSSKADFKVSPPVLAPFSRYTLTLFQPFEASGTYTMSDLEHSEFVTNPDCGWVTWFASKFNNSTGFSKLSIEQLPCVNIESLTDVSLAIKNNYQYLQFQGALLSLASPTRRTSVHLDPQHRPSVISWVLQQQAFKAFAAKPKSILHLHAGEESGLNIGAISQHLSYAYDNDTAAVEPRYGVFYFEFDRRDSRYNNIKAMISSYLNSVIWRFSDGAPSYLSWLFEYLNAFETWSLEDVLFFFFYISSYYPQNQMVLLLGSFDHCDQTTREMFVEMFLRSLHHSESKLRLIVSTNGTDAYLSKTVASSNAINLKDYTFAVGEYDTWTERTDTLDEAMHKLVEKRGALRRFTGEMNQLLEQCEGGTTLGFIILKWLEHYGRGAPVADIAYTLRSLSPVTYENVIRVFLQCLDGQKKEWAKIVWSWVAYAPESLTIEMLAQAVALQMFSSAETPTLSDIDYDMFYQDLQETFGGAIKRDGRDIKFSDDALYDIALVSAQEQKTEQQSSSSYIHGQMARTCLRYIMSTEGQKMLAMLSVENRGLDMDVPPLLLPPDSFVGYALRFWVFHYQSSGEYRPVSAAMGLFQDHSKMQTWAEALYVISNPFTRIRRCYVSPLPYMAMLGLKDLVLMETEKMKISSSFKKDCWLALTEAARNGHQTTLDLLLSHVEVDEAGLQETIHWAALYGEKEMLDTLVAEAEKVEDFKWPKYILTRAAAAGLDKLVSALADAGYDMNEEDASGTSRRALHLAAIFGRSRVIELMLAHGGADATLRDNMEQTPLMMAVEIQAPETVQQLVITNTNSGYKDGFGMTLAQSAVNMGHYKSLEVLIEAGADFQSGDMDNSRDTFVWIPIVLAAYFGYQECVRVLLHHGADPNAYSAYGSALYVAITNGPHIETCRMLLEKGANPNQSAADNDVYADKDMLLLQAIDTNNLEIVTLLLEHGAKVDSVDPHREKCDTPLSYAVAFSTIEMVELLLRWRADVNFVSDKDESVSPLYSAAWYSNNTNHKYIDLLVEYGADVHWRHKTKQCTPLIMSYDSPDLVRSLLKHGSDINAVEYEGWTTLMFAAYYSHVEVVRVLLQNTNPKPDLEAQSSLGWTTILEGCLTGNAEVVRLLLEAGADSKHTTNEGVDAFGVLVANSTFENSEDALQVIKLLLEYGANIDVINMYGEGALHEIKFSTPVSVIRTLVEAGAPINAVNNDGYTPLGNAISKGNIEAAKYLMTVEGVHVDVCHPNYGSILHLAVQSTSPLELTRQLIAAGADHTVVHPTSGKSLLYTLLEHTYDDPKVRIKLLRYLVEELHVDVNADGGKHKYPILQLLNGAWTEQSILEYLLRKGARVDVTDELGRGPAHYAGKLAHYASTLAILIKAKANFLLKDHYGRTPLHFTCANVLDDRVLFLIEKLNSVSKGFDINITDIDGWTPLMWYCRRRYPDSVVLKTLVSDYGADIWARSKDKEWSARKIASFWGWTSFVRGAQILEPGGEDMTRRDKDGKAETWDPAFHVFDRSELPGDGLDVCFSCLQVRYRIHPPPPPNLL